MIQKLKTLFIAGLAMIAVKTYSQSITITPAITQQSNLFKSLQGQDRKAALLPLQALFLTISKTATCSGSSSTTFTSRSEVYNLLGTPDAILSPNLVSYNLSSNNQNCVVEIGIDNQDRVIFSNINNCP